MFDVIILTREVTEETEFPEALVNIIGSDWLCTVAREDVRNKDLQRKELDFVCRQYKEAL